MPIIQPDTRNLPKRNRILSPELEVAVDGKAGKKSAGGGGKKVRTVNLDADLHLMATFIAVYREVPMTEYLRGLIERQVKRDYAEVIQALVAKQKADEKK